MTRHRPAGSSCGATAARRVVTACVAALVAAAIGCGPAGAFPCVVDDDCLTGAVQGTCEMAGFCSFPDDVCPSGQRYGEHAGGGLARECVPAGATTGLGESTRGETSVAVTTLESTAPVPTSSGDSSGDAESTTAAGCPATWLDCGHPWRRVLAIQGPDEAIADFVVPWRFTLADATAGRHEDLSTLRLFDTAGTSLAVDFERPLVDGSVVAWIRVPQVGNGTEIVLYYGGVPTTTQPDASAVWSPEYIEVWHGDGEPGRVGGRMFEESSIAYALGQYGAAPDFDGQASRLRDFDLPVFPPTASLSAWIYPRSWGEITFARIFDSRENPAGGAGFSVLIADGNGPLDTISFVQGCEGGDAEWVAPGNSIELGAWQHVTVAIDNEADAPTPEIYVDGVGQPLEQLYGGDCFPRPPSGVFAVGNVGDALSRTFDGLIDEIRVRNGLPDPARVAVEFAAGSPDFVSLGEPQAQ